MIPRAVFLAVGLVASLLLGPESHTTALGARGGTPDIRIEDVAVRLLADVAGQETTISFRVRNGGAEVAEGVRTDVFPGELVGTTLKTRSVSTPVIMPGETVYFSLTVVVPSQSAPGEASITVTGAGGSLVFAKSTVPFLSRPPAPGKWVSIGPRVVFAPGNPAIELGSFSATGRLAAIAVHPANPKIIYVGSPGELGHEGCGLWKTSNGGVSWAPITDSLPTLSIAAVTIDPTKPDRVYVVTSDRGLFKSEDAGTSWDHVYSHFAVLRNTRDGDPTVLLVDPESPNVLFLTTAAGVLRSENYGANWIVSLGVDGAAATSLVMDPQDHDVLYAAIQGKGVYKTVNGGKWPSTGGSGWTLEPLPSVGATNSPALGILLAIAHPAPTSPATVYALLGRPDEEEYGRTLYRKVEGGILPGRGSGTWAAGYYCEARVWGRPFGECLFNVMAVDPGRPDRVYLGGPILKVSTDGGESFFRMPQVGKEDRQPYAPHGDYHGWAFHPSDPAIIFAATDGGIYRSDDHGQQGSWSFIGIGITNTEMYDLVSGELPPRWLFAGTQDNGTMLYSGSVYWDHVYPAQPTALNQHGYGGDGALVAMDPTDNNLLYVMEQYQDSIVKSSDAGQSDFQKFAQGLPAAASAQCAAYNSSFYFQIDPTNPSTPNDPAKGWPLIATCGALYRTATNVPPGDWQPVFYPPHGRLVRSAIDASTGLYYLGTTAASVGDDHGIGTAAGIVYAGKPSAGFQKLFEHPDHLPVSDIDVDALHPESVYVTFARRYQVDRGCSDEPQARVFRITRRSALPSAETVTVTNITGQSTEAGQTGLPFGLCANTLAIDPRPPLTLYVGTQDGVFRGRVQSTGGRMGWGEVWSWTPYNDGLPHTDVRDLELHPRFDLMYAATYGRGAFEVFLAASRPAPK